MLKYNGVSSLQSKFNYVFNIFNATQKRNVLSSVLLNGMLCTSGKIMQYWKNNSYKLKILLQTRDFKTIVKSLLIRIAGKHGYLCMKCQQNSCCWG